MKGRAFVWPLGSSKGTTGPSGLRKILVGSIPGPQGPGWVNYWPSGPPEEHRVGINTRSADAPASMPNDLPEFLPYICTPRCGGTTFCDRRQECLTLRCAASPHPPRNRCPVIAAKRSCPQQPWRAITGNRFRCEELPVMSTGIRSQSEVLHFDHGGACVVSRK